ncbi:N-acetylmuramoyl-L-alanine amidase AmiC [Sulfurihydrogenibium azorense Az-Fu1]|uniref:N-acetylmuramoyl-L-alanine amidase n=1 Tax=Sulfurihydrogenibium azorense (strain DSM 15241 / OCM 825 / Az-Fu1) TaxID=204536 RepID=C1DX34_SULAA|nr:N-acetylmuramoyl-L-alanine amidase [Sulfurihydrogenibium azorense]ACN98993.1 N-acetylmuramoyl-L-alanine amidase AmiC [Sulfurihydrogenibium azorense Az-Fu1]
MVRFLLMLLIFIISFSFGFEIRTGEYEDKVRIVLDGVKNADIVTVSNNLILKVSEKYKNSNFKLNNSSIKEIEIYTNEEKNSSLIYITLQEGLSYKYFSLSNPDRFVIDIMKVSTVKNQIQKTEKKDYQADVLDTILKNLENQTKNTSLSSFEIEVPKNFSGKKKVIVIDPGHGGHDPGAMANGLKEKDINLKVALKLKNYLEKDGRFKVYLTRDDDYFVPLYDRTLIALEKKADLFISIHTNASENPNLSGTYVYTLNLKGATSKLAKMVEERENKTVLNVVKVSTNPNVNKIVADMAISHTMTEGLNFAKFIEVNAKNLLPDTEFKRIESANFAVLKTPSIPAVLVETAFITNEKDAKLLANDKFLDNLAKVLYKSIVDYFFKYKNLVFKGKAES